MRRRDFLKRTGLGAAALAAMPLTSGLGYAGPRRAETQVLVYGGGAGGLMAGIQAARMGAEVLVVEPSPWIGGMLTAAGVSALDGNKYGAGGGLVHAFREGLAAHYGSMEALFTGWISLYCYEPHVGHRLLQQLAAPLPTLTILTGADVVAYRRAPGARLATVRTAAGTETEVAADVFLDATEYGDGLKLAGLPYRLGRESRDELGEPAAPAEADLEMQDLTYAATLVRRPGAAPLPATATERAYWTRFQCSTTLDCPDPDEALLGHTVHDWESFITYAALPNDKVLLNWPHHANDFPVNVAFFEDRYYRQRHLGAARLHTLQYVKYLQNALGHPEWQIAEDEYPTADHLPPIPYLRESRRLTNGQVLAEDAVTPVAGRPRAPWIADSIAVGDYFIDHHHSKHHLPPERRLVEDYPDNAPFQIPPSVFFPAEDAGDDRFLVGEKSIAVSHIVNGCTRLQPPVMLMGQALGAYAARAAREGVAPRRVPTAAVQQDLLDAGCQLYIWYDVPTGHPLFRPAQELALRGVFRDDEPTHLEPDAPLAEADAARWARRAGLDPDALPRTKTRGAFVEGLHARLTAAG